MRGRPRGMEQVALDFRTAEDANLLQLLRRLHPFGGDPHTEASRQINGGADDGASLALIRQTQDETAIDLDSMERETQQISERRITGTKVVHRKMHAEFMQAF